ncbi:hypothetical protein DPMN_027556 [Dreissena polymorpha]|uniref:Uncharacterized protein n=1 Tax=Dreissena polymorpha TaxID=45954 RepID=A0A9D4LX92_DREPO|nr:hypothetical protein DPMN_027556 [Dreissena polymorpha]
MARQRPTHGRPRINCIVIREVQYQFEVNRCRNEEIIVKGNFRWEWSMWAWWPMWAGRQRIDRIVIREVQYQFEVNRCRNEETIVKGNSEWAWPMWAWPMWAGCPRIDRIVIREVQYQFEVNRLKGKFGWAWPMWPGRPRIDRIVIREAQYQFEFQGSSGQDGRTEAHHHNIPTFSPKNNSVICDMWVVRWSSGNTGLPFQRSPVQFLAGALGISDMLQAFPNQLEIYWYET